MKKLIRIGTMLIGGILGCSTALADGLLIDFGADATPTFGGSLGEISYWNNITTEGTDDFGYLEPLATTDGNFSSIGLQMISRFNASNENGTLSSRAYPMTATRDSLYGNTENFNGLSDIAPAFKLYGLDATATYSFTFFASRTGVTDNRETRFTVTGGEEKFADLDAANNQTNVVVISDIAPDGAAEITIALTPGPNNNNANHFTYLNILEIKASTGEKILLDFGASSSTTDFVEAPPSAYWNNLFPAIGTTDSGILKDLMTTNGTSTFMALRMESRFNASNSGGVSDSSQFPATATQDSLFGNVESFNDLSNIAPAFYLTGLDTNFVFSFTFYGSRVGVTDNRETRYSVSGANDGEALLNTANNTNDTVTVSDIRPNEAGEIRIALSPGPNNNNANHFTYLGVMKVDFGPFQTPRVLIDFGDVNTTELGIDDPNNAWNNVTAGIGATDNGTVPNLVRTDSRPTTMAFQMISRFNGANGNGTQTGVPYPIDATRDSLFGNTEEFGSGSNITPIFKITGLSSQVPYDLAFYASRNEVGDNRETRYTVTGATESFVDLNAANNETEIATITGVLPDANGELRIALTPGPNNNNANHFTYLGVLQIDWPEQNLGEAPSISSPQLVAGTFKFTVTGTQNAAYTVQSTTDFSSWDDVKTITLTSESQQVEVSASGAAAFYRLVAQ